MQTSTKTFSPRFTDKRYCLLLFIVFFLHTISHDIMAAILIACKKKAEFNINWIEKNEKVHSFIEWKNNSSHISLIKCLFAKYFQLYSVHLLRSPLSPCSIIQLELIIENACTVECVSSHWKMWNIFYTLFKWLSFTPGHV